MSLAAAVGGTANASGRVIYVDVNTVEVQALLTRFGLAVGEYSLRMFLEGPATQFFQEDIESRFEEEGDAKSGFWPPLAPATIDIRRADGYGDGPINVRTGELKDFMLSDYPVKTGVAWSEMDVPGNPGGSLLAEKLATAQRGSSNNPLGFGPTPPRPVLAVSEMDLFSLVELLQVHIVNFALTGLR